MKIKVRIPFIHDVPDCEFGCGGLGNFEVNGTFGCLPCWQKNKPEIAREIVSRTAYPGSDDE